MDKCPSSMIHSPVFPTPIPNPAPILSGLVRQTHEPKATITTGLHHHCHHHGVVQLAAALQLAPGRQRG